MLSSWADETVDLPISETRHQEFRSSVVGLFLPTLFIAVGYGVLWFSLLLSERSDGPLARLCMFVLIVGIPILIAYCLMRYITTSIQLYEVSAQVHAGFPRRDPVDIPYRFMEYIEVHYGFLGRLTKSATLKIGLTANKAVEINHVYEPERAKLAIELEIAKSAKKMLVTELDCG